MMKSESLFHFARTVRRLLAFLLLGCAYWTLGADESVMEPWLSEATGLEISRVQIIPEGVSAEGALPTVIYLKNLAAPRIGRDADEEIIADFLLGGMMVVILDYEGNAQARVPYLNRDLLNMRADILEDETAVQQGTVGERKFMTGRRMDAAHIFIVPEGCRLMRDVAYEPPRGMDIIYPSNPAVPVGAILQFSADNANRMGNFSMAVTHDSILSGQASEGFVVAMADHPVSGGYNGIDPMPKSAWSVRAAVQTLRAQAGVLPLNGRVATLGFSRGSGVALMAMTTVDVEQWTIYLGSQAGSIVVDDADVKVGEHPDEEASVQGAVIMSGRFTYIDLLPTDGRAGPQGLYTNTWGPVETNFDVWRDHGALDYLHRDPGFPLFLTINKDDEHAHHQMNVLRARLTELGVDFIFREDTVEPKAHRMPLDHTILRDMNQYLKSVLMDPNPYAALSSLRLQATLEAEQQVHWLSPDIMPDLDYLVQVSADLDVWSDWGVVQPDESGLLDFTVDLQAGEPVFVRVVPPGVE